MSYLRKMMIGALAVMCAGVAGRAGETPAPKTLIWNYVNLTELRQNAKIWHDVKGIDGFLFCCIGDKDMVPTPPRWTSGPEEIIRIHKKLPETVKALRSAGIDSNFVHAGIEDPGWDWFDSKRYAKIVPTFRQLAKVAKASGCKGVAIDTEPYACDKTLWNPDGYPAAKLPELKKRIRTMGAEVIHAIMTEFPEAEILVVIEGSYIAVQNSPSYKIFDLWIDFFDGMVSQRPAQGITVISEVAYNWSDPLQIARLCGSVEGTIQQAFLGRPEALTYARGKCSVAMGAAVMGQSDKTTKLSPAEFAVQWKTMQALSPRYVMIFAGESGFWQWTAEMTGSLPSFKKPLAANADQYFKVIRESRKQKK